MKRIFLLFSLLFALNGFSQTTFSQYFDGADTSVYSAILIEIDSGSVWQIGPPDKDAYFKNASTVPNVIVTDTVNPYPVNDTSRFQVDILNEGFNWGILAFEWTQKLDLDSLADWGDLEFSMDNGQSWQSAFDNPFVYNFYGFNSQNVDYMPSGNQAFTAQDTVWKNVWLCFDLSWVQQFTDTMEFRFSLYSDSVQNDREGWMIDNMLAHYTLVHTLEEIEPENYMTVYPNPTEGRVYINTKKIPDFHIIEQMDLFDINGQVVQSWENVPTKFFIDIDSHPPGIYYLKVRTNLQTEEFKIIMSD